MSSEQGSDINESARRYGRRGDWADSFALGVATCLGIGRCPEAPGTVGSLVGIPVYLLLEVQPWGLRGLSLLALVALAIWAAGRAMWLLGERDPSCVVIDEVAGLVVALSWVEPRALSMVLGFALFRLFDITKVPPLGWVERRLAGGLGVVGDDLLAGLYANVSLRLVMAMVG
ncbi:MAG: phosphatidylglycerophosphatase A family protein [Thermodesulfobacteriota bacterium]